MGTMGRYREGGFTLIELMVTMFVAAILLALAVPAYTTQITKSRRTDARTALLDLATREERYYSLNNAYTSNSANLGYGVNGFPVLSSGGYYKLAVPNVQAAAVGTAATFIATATPTGSQLTNDTQCGTFNLTNTGQESVSGPGGAATCWN
jgi:type IV pilus assembly protein PilE